MLDTLKVISHYLLNQWLDWCKNPALWTIDWVRLNVPPNTL